MHYKIITNNGDKIFVSKMIFTAVARFLMQMNACVNPIVYATTIPAFRKVVKKIFSCNLVRKENGIEESTESKSIDTSKNIKLLCRLKLDTRTGP